VCSLLLQTAPYAGMSQVLSGQQKHYATAESDVRAGLGLMVSVGVAPPPSPPAPFSPCPPTPPPNTLNPMFLCPVTAAGPSLSWDVSGAVWAAEELRSAVRGALGLVVSVGVGPNKLLAKLGSRAAKPDGVHALGSVGAVQGLLASTPVDRLPGVLRVILRNVWDGGRGEMKRGQGPKEGGERSRGAEGSWVLHEKYNQRELWCSRVCTESGWAAH
jgi:hypothetical protein